MLFTFRCGAGHHFQAEGEYSQFDMAKPCAVSRCKQPAFMLVTEMGPMHTPGGASASADRETYFAHNVTFTGTSADGTVTQHPNSHSLQCGCEKCCRHRKRASVTEVADAAGRNSAGKEVRI